MGGTWKSERVGLECYGEMSLGCFFDLGIFWRVRDMEGMIYATTITTIEYNTLCFSV